jgi:hypothetical protein
MVRSTPRRKMQEDGRGDFMVIMKRAIGNMTRIIEGSMDIDTLLYCLKMVAWVIVVRGDHRGDVR